MHGYHAARRSATGLIVAIVAIVAVALAVVPGSAAPSVAVERTSLSFRTSDGVTIRGFRFGDGRAVVIFSHMYGTDQRIWFPLAEKLARRGYTAITYDYRGIGRSGGRLVIAETYRDALGAVDFARRQRRGFRPVILIGASLGGTVSVKAAALRRVQGVVVMASGMQFRGLDVRPHLSTLRPAKLFISGSGDQPFATSVRTMYAQTPTPKSLRIYRSAAHGTHLFATRHGPAIESEILAFVHRHTR